MIRNLETFITVAQLLNFGEAARSLNYSQSTVSEQIRSLEEELQTRLFERIGRKVFLTKQGETLLPYAKRFRKDAENLKVLFKSEDGIAGTIMIGAAESICTYWLPPLLKEYRRLYPNVQINIRVGCCVDFPQWLQNDLIDIAFSLRNDYREPQLQEQVLFEGQTVFIAAPDHELALMDKFELANLAEQTILMPEGYSGYPMDLKKLLEKEQIKISNILEFGSIETIKQCVKSGLGVSLLPEIAVEEEINRGELVKLNWLKPCIPIKGLVVYHREKWLSPQLVALNNLILTKLK